MAEEFDSMNLIYSSVRATSETSRSCGRHWPTGDWGSPDECKDLLGCPERVWIPICQPHAHRGQCHNLEWRGGKDTGRYCSIGVERGLEDDRTYNLSCTLLISGGSLFSLYTTRDPILSQHHNSQRVSSYNLFLGHTILVEQLLVHITITHERPPPSWASSL